MQFLMGLNDNFKPVRGQILLMKPLPIVEDAYSMIQPEEKQMDISLFISLNEHSTMLMSGKGNNQQKKWIQTTPVQGNNWSQTHQSDKSSLYCEHCYRIGHVQEKCFKLHGFPANYKPKGKHNGNNYQRGSHTGHSGNMVQQTTFNSPNSGGYTGSYSNGEASSVVQVNNATAPLQQTPHLTPDQITQLLSLLKPSETSNSSQHLAGLFAEDNCGTW
ncbi:hypothetical protein BUALT_Bualt11G0073100 [Buddleja alternifolia]|uniref:Uncharacterized protein n=1 Tax=Buddleja alternifolia TaxID=168488 RepID=A0AAV6X430_9LAMI|nr:hypothetical protein BUALT_Bualt11G0073100 [Buddleja alternifolia]